MNARAIFGHVILNAVKNPRVRLGRRSCGGGSFAALRMTLEGLSAVTIAITDP
jgi:hypothetical protein